MILSAKNLSFGHTRPIQRGLNFSVQAGECLWISGSNGTGKTLLGRVIAGFHPYEGQLHNTFRKVSYLPQVQEPLNHFPYQLRDLSPKHYFLEPEQLDLAWNTASGGERQKALLDRTFQREGDLFILDEPFNHLDQASKQKLQIFLNEFFSREKKTLVLVSHDAEPDRWWGLPLTKLELKGTE
jgi:ABC-type Mn2+/Zn2+ transport system ATPase subunit